MQKISAQDTLVKTEEILQKPKLLFTRPLSKNVKMRYYFAWIDSVCAHYDSLLNYPINEYLLVRANPWIVDTLANTDYYIQKKRGNFIEDQKEMVILAKGDSLLVPDSLMADSISKLLKNTVIDVNIPEFTLRIMEYNKIVRECLVRVGRQKRQFLKTAGREVYLQTQTGRGEIVRVERDPYYVNPTNGKRYYATKRDDGKYTKMPRIPWLEPELDGERPGTLIHPTTNPETLGKPYSHGCVGMNENDAWYVYYSAPVGTKVVFRYNLLLVNAQGDTIKLKDIYHQNEKSKKPE